MMNNLTKLYTLKNLSFCICTNKPAKIRNTRSILKKKVCLFDNGFFASNSYEVLSNEKNIHSKKTELEDFRIFTFQLLTLISLPLLLEFFIAK